MSDSLCVIFIKNCNDFSHTGSYLSIARIVMSFKQYATALINLRTIIHTHDRVREGVFPPLNSSDREICRTRRRVEGSDELRVESR